MLFRQNTALHPDLFSGNCTHLHLAAGQSRPAVGASASVAAVVGVYAAFLPRAKIYLYGILGIPAAAAVRRCDAMTTEG